MLSQLALVPNVAACLVSLALRLSVPKTKGTITLAGLDGPVVIRRDERGVPHIAATTQRDAFFAWGFSHAQDRSWQLELMRRAASGTLAEILGEKALATDRFMRRVGLSRTAAAQYAKLPAHVRESMEAYAEGITAWWEQVPRYREPPEFLLLGIRPSPWTACDSAAIAKFISFALAPNWDTQIVRMWLIERVGPECAASLEPQYVDASVLALPPKVRFGVRGPELLYEYGGLAEWIKPASASNAWAVDGTKTESGLPLLANDIHNPASLPSLWYEIHAQGGTELDVAGVSIPGFPGVLAGRNAHLAWGISSGMANQQDLFVEKCNPKNPTQYRWENTWHQGECVTETIFVRGKKPVRENVLVTRHGPVISPLIEGAMHALSLKSVVLESLDQMTAVADFMNARTIPLFRKALRHWASPSLGFVFADRRGNIGWQFAGYLPKRPSRSGLVPGRGWKKEDEWQGYLPFEELPHAINPPSHLVAAANNLPFAAAELRLSGEWADSWRIRRITELLEQGNSFSLEDFSRMQNDTHSEFARELLAMFPSFAPKHFDLTQCGELVEPDPELSWAMRELASWDFRVSASSRAAAIFEAFVYRLYYNLFAEKLGEDIDYYLGKGVHEAFSINAMPYRSASHLLRFLPEHDALERIAAQSLKEALAFLKQKLGRNTGKWQWGRLHTITFAHAFAQIPLLGKFFCTASFALSGDINTIPQASYHPMEPFAAKASVPLWRHNADLAAFDRTFSVTVPGQSGHPTARHAKNQIASWLSGALYELPFETKRVQQKSVATLVLKPIR